MEPSEVDGLISDEQGLVMQDYARRMIPGVAVEIGSYRGKSACYIAQAMPEGSHLFCIDAWQNSADLREKQYRTDENLGLFKKNVAACGVEKNVTPIQGFSTTVAKEWNRPISYLYIDGGHEYDEVLADIDGFAPHVVDGGFILFDDYSPAFAGLQAAVAERFPDVVLHEVDGYGRPPHKDHPRYLGVVEK